jgi:hypothetical protein
MRAQPSLLDIERRLAAALHGQVDATMQYDEGVRTETQPGLSPAIISESTATALAETCAKVVSATRLLVEIPEAREYIGAVSSGDTSFAWNVRQTASALPLARPDVVVANGAVKVVEVNATSRLGMLFEHDFLAQRFEAEPLTRDLIRKHGLARGSVTPELEKMFKACMPMSGKVCIAISNKLKIQAEDRISWLAKSVLTALGYEVFVIPVGELRLSNDGDLRHPAYGRFDGLYRLFGLGDLIGTQMSQAALLGALRRERFAIFDDPAGEILVNKIVMELLSSEDWLARLPLPLAAGLRHCVPWTRVMKASIYDPQGRSRDAESYAIAGQSSLVLKPAQGSGGVWVVIGANVSADFWRRAVRNALRSKMTWVIQEFAQADAAAVPRWDGDRTFDHDRAVNFGVLCVNETCGGIVRRDDTAGRVNLNATQGSRVVPAYWPPIAGKAEAPGLL